MRKRHIWKFVDAGCGRMVQFEERGTGGQLQLPVAIGRQTGFFFLFQHLATK